MLEPAAGQEEHHFGIGLKHPELLPADEQCPVIEPDADSLPDPPVG
jgi:hypothetical protein